MACIEICLKQIKNFGCLWQKGHPKMLILFKVCPAIDAP
jgi:hypothetical protein